MEVIELARKLSDLQQVSEAQKAYFLVLQQSSKDIERYEAALYLLYTGANKKISYTVLLELYKKGIFRDEIMKNMMDFALVPVIGEMEKIYSKNVELLKNYKFIFKKEFKEFEDLNKRFFKVDDNGYVPYDLTKGEFAEYQPIYQHKIQHYFFKNLENPIKAEDIFSQYELEYLYDNVRKSEWVAKDNHIYLCYSSFEEFQEYLPVIDFSKILKDEKFVFLFNEEKNMYPIDFKEKYGIDYRRFKVKPFKACEFNKLVWSVQYMSHNGGDFFNEIMDGHPYMVCSTSRMMKGYVEKIEELRGKLSSKDRYKVSSKDLLIMLIMKENRSNVETLDKSSRIVPAIYFQPHYGNVEFELKVSDGIINSSSKQFEDILKYDFIKEFKYIKSFIPIRRFTSSYAASVRFIFNLDFQKKSTLISNPIVDRLLNRALYIDKSKRSYSDAIVVRFEDGKLNPKATFTALAEFLDIPYTESMTYCSLRGKVNPVSIKGNVRGFDTATVYRTYDEYCDVYERKILEYFLSDEMRKYEYDKQYLNKDDISLEELLEWVDKRYVIKERMIEFRKNYYLDEENLSEEESNSKALKEMGELYNSYRENLKEIVTELYQKPKVVNSEGIELELADKLELDESLLEQPLYR